MERRRVRGGRAYRLKHQLELKLRTFLDPDLEVERRRISGVRERG